MMSSLKRARTACSSGGKRHADAKDDPPRKVKKAKSSQHVPSAAGSRPPPAVSSLGGLSLFGEQSPPGGYEDIPEAADLACSELKAVLSQVCELKQSSTPKALVKIEAERQRGVLLFSNLKKLNRLSHLYCKDARDRTHEQKLEVDSLYLQLQNLMYEAMHIRREITSCLEFESQHEDIALVPEEDFFSSAPDGIALTERSGNDQHRLMLGRLEWELEQRKQLYKQQEGLEAVLSREQADIAATSSSLGSLVPVLEGIRKATLPLQASLNIPLDRHREENQTAQLLPAALYVGFMQARAYSEVEDNCLAVSITGDVGEAKAAAGVSPSNERSDEDSGGDSDAEGGTKERRKKRRKRGKSSRENKDVSKCFPLAVSLVLTLKELGAVQVVLSYLPRFCAVCAAVSSLAIDSLSEAQLSTYLDKTALLHCLFESDTGRTSPNAVVTSHIRKLGGDVFSMAVRQHGFPYKWVQRVCGVDSGGGGEVAGPRDEVAADNIGVVVRALRERFTAQTHLIRQLIALDEGRFLLKHGDEELFSAAPHSQFVRWKVLALAEAQALPIASLPVFNSQERTNRFFLAQFQHSQGAKLHCLVCVGGEFPSAVPTLAVMVEWSGGQREPHTLQIKNLEADVNLDFPAALRGDPHGEYLLCRQLRRLQDTFDVYMEFKSSTGKSGSSKRKALFRIRGRGRLLALQD